MNNLNSILIEGNLVRDPAYRTTPKGTPVCNFTIASNRYFRRGEQGYEREVGFFNVETWAKLAETCNRIGTKGRGVRCVGRLREDRWTGEDGKNHSRVVVVAEHVEFRPDFSKAAKESAQENTEAYTETDDADPPKEYADDDPTELVEVTQEEAMAVH